MRLSSVQVQQLAPPSTVRRQVPARTTRSSKRVVEEPLPTSPDSTSEEMGSDVSCASDDAASDDGDTPDVVEQSTAEEAKSQGVPDSDGSDVENMCSSQGSRAYPGNSSTISKQKAGAGSRRSSARSALKENLTK